VTATVGAKRAPAPKPRRAESLPADERRAMIIEAMLPLLLEHGEMVTTRQIAEAAGIAEGTIFRVFADKDELIAAVVDHATDPTRVEEAFAAIDTDLPLEAAVTEAVRILQRRTLDMARLMASVGPRHHRRGPMPDRPALIAIFAAHRDSITVEPAAAARWLAAMTMSTSHPLIATELLPPERIATLFLHGVGNEDRPC
jgi:AcrR family transcriptional regulator